MAAKSVSEASAKAAEATDSETADYVLEEQAGYLLRRAYQRSTAIFASLIGDLNLTPRQFSALVKVMEEESVSQNELGRLTAMDPATMQGVMGRLNQRGLVARRPDPHDRRRTLLSLTPAGRDLVDRGLFARGHRITEATLAPLRPNEREAFLRLLKKLI